MAYNLTRDGNIGILEMASPPANAYTKDMMLELQRCLDEARNDDQVRCVVVKSALERFFCAGADISTLVGATAGGFADFLTMAHETMDMIEKTPRSPAIASAAAWSSHFPAISASRPTASTASVWARSILVCHRAWAGPSACPVSSRPVTRSI